MDVPYKIFTMTTHFPLYVETLLETVQDINKFCTCNSQPLLGYDKSRAFVLHLCVCSRVTSPQMVKWVSCCFFGHLFVLLIYSVHSSLCLLPLSLFYSSVSLSLGLSPRPPSTNSFRDKRPRSQTRQLLQSCEKVLKLVNNLFC